MTEMFIIPLAKTYEGIKLLDRAHNRIYNDNNEKKTSRHDEKLVQFVLCLIYTEPEYANHISIMKMPISIRERCSIACARSDSEYIYLMPDLLVDPLNKDNSLISEMSYYEVRNSIQVIIDRSRFQTANINTNTDMIAMPMISEPIEIASTQAPPSTPASTPSSTPSSIPSFSVMTDDDIFIE
jgi:hypothetical protein